MTSSGRGSEADKRKDRRIPLVQEIECKGEAVFRKRLSDISVGDASSTPSLNSHPGR